MSQQTPVFSRISRWFRRPGPSEEISGNGAESNGTPENGAAAATTPGVVDPAANVIEPRGTLLRPWGGRRDDAITNIQVGLNSLTGLMGAIRENLEAQNRRQEELIQHLATLPKVLDTIPDTTRMHGETLKAIHEQIANQGEQQEKLSEILQAMGKSGGDQAQILESLKGSVAAINEHDRHIADNLRGVGNAMETVSHNSQTSAEVLQSLRENITSRDGELQKVIHRQGTRFTTMLAIAIFLAMSAVAAVAVLGWMLYQQQHHM